MLVPSSEWQPMIQNLQLQPLCSLILERTINDPDKYQSGLTKIFFRAGMLAALESLRSGRLNALVTVVQKNMRRRMAVKKYQESKGGGSSAKEPKAKDSKNASPEKLKSNEIIRIMKDGRKAVFDSKTKEFLRFLENGTNANK